MNRMMRVVTGFFFFTIHRQQEKSGDDSSTMKWTSSTTHSYTQASTASIHTVVKTIDGICHNALESMLGIDTVSIS